MKIGLKPILIGIFVVISLIAGNVYQYRNPKVVEVPQGQQKIDSTAWVKRAAYATRGMIIDSLKSQNKKLSERIRQSKDQIANYTSITGKLRLKVDSLETQPPVRIDSFFVVDTTAKASPDLNVMDTTLTFHQTFSDSLFDVQSSVIFDWPYLDNNLLLSQRRPIRLDVVNTMNDDRSRMLTYVTSPDFDSLRYQTYTELKPKHELPRFWIGAGLGVAGTLATLIVLR